MELLSGEEKTKVAASNARCRVAKHHKGAAGTGQAAAAGAHVGRVRAAEETVAPRPKRNVEPGRRPTALLKGAAVAAGSGSRCSSGGGLRSARDGIGVLDAESAARLLLLAGRRWGGEGGGEVRLVAAAAPLQRSSSPAAAVPREARGLILARAPARARPAARCCEAVTAKNAAGGTQPSRVHLSGEWVAGAGAARVARGRHGVDDGRVPVTLARRRDDDLGRLRLAPPGARAPPTAAQRRSNGWRRAEAAGPGAAAEEGAQAKRGAPAVVETLEILPGGVHHRGRLVIHIAVAVAVSGSCPPGHGLRVEAVRGQAVAAGSLSAEREMQEMGSQ